MPKTNPDSPGDNTNVIVNSMREQRRSMRVPIIVGTIGMAGLAAIMALGLGSKREENYKIDETKPGGEVRQMLSAQGHSSDSAGQLGAVEVRLNAGGSLMIDGKNHGSATKHSLKLEIGPHTFVNKRKAGPALSETIAVLANHTVQVDFDKKKTRVSAVAAGPDVAATPDARAP